MRLNQAVLVLVGWAGAASALGTGQIRARRDPTPPALSSASRRQILDAVPAAAVAAALIRGLTQDGVASAPMGKLADPTSALPAALLDFAAEARAAATAAMVCAPSYHRDGVTVVRNVVSPFWVNMLRGAVEEAQDEGGPGAQYLDAPTDAGTFFTDLDIGRRLPSFAAFALYGPCAAIAGAITGAREMRYLYDQIFVKEPGVSLPTPWHQDGGYWRVRGARLASVFVALDTVAKSECLAFVPSTHSWHLHNPAHFADGSAYRGTGLPPLPDVEALCASGALPSPVQFALEPGDVLVFSSHTVHGGRGNWGRAVSTRWAGDDSVFWDRPGEGAVPSGDVRLRDGQPLAMRPEVFPAVWGAEAAR